MKRAEDHFEGGFVGELRVRIDGDAAPVVTDGDGAVFVEFDLDAVGVPRDGFVHRVVEDFGHKVVQRAFIGAANIHARAFANRFQAFEDLNRGRVIGLGLRRIQEVICHVFCSFCCRIRPVAAGIGNGGNGARACFELFPNWKISVHG